MCVLASSCFVCVHVWHPTWYHIGWYHVSCHQKSCHIIYYDIWYDIWWSVFIWNHYLQLTSPLISEVTKVSGTPCLRWQRHRTGCSWSPFQTLPYHHMVLHAGGALVVWPGMLFSNSDGVKAAVNLYHGLRCKHIAQLIPSSLFQSVCCKHIVSAGNTSTRGCQERQLAPHSVSWLNSDMPVTLKGSHTLSVAQWLWLGMKAENPQRGPLFFHYFWWFKKK